MATIASLVSIILSVVAAGFWGSSAMANLPVIKGSYAVIENLGPFYKALTRIARLNAIAAFFTLVSAVAQGLALYISTHGS